MLSLMNIRMYGHMHGDIKMEQHVLNNFVLHNELPISHCLAVKCKKPKKNRVKFKKNLTHGQINNFVLHNEIPILHRSKVIGMMMKKVEK